MTISDDELEVIEVEFTDEEYDELVLMAAERGLTLDALLVQILTEMIDDAESEPDTDVR